MLTMTQKNHIRKMFFEQGMNISQIASETNNDRKTVRKYLDQDNWSQEPKKIPANKSRSKLDPFKAEIDGWLEDDKKSRRKQRHTAKRVYDRLVALHKEDFDCGYKTVANYVSQRRKEIYTQKEGFLPLQHIPGEAQVDFGEADFYENSHLYSGHYLNLSFPHSNQGYTQLFKGENQECLFQGMINIFNHIGGVPLRIWFDNASTMVSKILKGGKRDLTDGFMRFQNHFGFEAVFCNPESGNEKGSVEGKVGYHRRNLLVPVPQITDPKSFNKELLTQCDEDGKRNHYKKDEEITTLHLEDKANLLPLPQAEFEACRYELVRVDSYGKFKLEKGLHEYSTAPKYAGGKVQIKITAYEVIVLDDTLREVINHRRLYGNTKQESMQWIPYLEQLSVRPGALKYTGIYQMLPTPLQQYMDLCDKSERGTLLKAILKISKASDFNNAVNAVSEAVTYGAVDPDSLMAVYSRMMMPDFKPKPLILPEKVPALDKIKPNAQAYDEILKKAGGFPC
ncbi:IS21 family transposase [Bacillota bacterium]